MPKNILLLLSELGLKDEKKAYLVYNDVELTPLDYFPFEVRSILKENNPKDELNNFLIKLAVIFFHLSAYEIVLGVNSQLLELYENGSLILELKSLGAHEKALGMIRKLAISFNGKLKPLEVYCFSDFLYVSNGTRFIFGEE